MLFSILGLLVAAGRLIGGEAEFVPGYLTDPTADYREDAGADDYETPAAHRYPYIATHYVKATVAPDEPVRIGYRVTDWENSLERKGDTSFRFDVELKLTQDNKSFRIERQKDVSDGDGVFELGTIAEGDWIVGVRCTEKRSGLSSHWVWQRFRVIDPKKLAIPEKETYRMTAADLAAYGLDNRGAFAREVKVAAPEFPEGLKDANKRRQFVKAYVEKYADAHPSKGSRGYAIYAPYHENGQCLHHTFLQSAVRYDADYDKAAVWAMSERNSQGLQRLLDEKRAAGIRKLALLPGTYRVCATNTLSVPSGLTLDMNGATIKVNEFTGYRSLAVCIEGPSRDTHVVNGTIETDYFEHDYEHSEMKSEWVQGAGVGGDCSYCSFENVTFRDMTGNGLGNGLSKKWYFAEPRHIRGSQKTSRFVSGTIDPKTGELVADASRWTGEFVDITSFVPHKFVVVSKNLGYQGLAARSWYMTVAFYDRERKFLSSEVAFQYRRMLIPSGAVYARTSIEAKDEKEADEAKLCYCLHRVPWNCTVRGNRFFRVRGVGYTPSQMSNWLIADNEFSHSGETFAACAFNAEDGWDQMQDALIVRNRFHDNARNELHCCAGHNFMFADNEGTMIFWDRVLAPTVRNNDLTRRGYRYEGYDVSRFHGGCRNRMLHSRFGKNVWGFGVELGYSPKKTDWDIVIRNAELKGTTEAPIFLGAGTGGRFLDCTIADARLENGNFENCRILRSAGSMSYHGDFALFRRCRLEDFTYLVGIRHRPVSLRFLDCDISVGARSFLRMPLSAMDRVAFDGGRIAFTGTKASLVEITDLRGDSSLPDGARLALLGLSVTGMAPSLIRVGATSPQTKTAFKLWKKGLKGADIPLFDAKTFPAQWSATVK